MKPDILIVDDDPAIRSVVRVTLEKAGMTVADARDGRGALQAIAENHCDLVVLDIGMPDMDGFACCRAIRANSNVPVLFLTAQDDEIDRVLGFELGADDYVTKPFSPRELVLRIKAILARVRPVQDHVVSPRVISHGDLVVDLNRHACTLRHQALDLTATEFAVLSILLARPGFVLDRNMLINQAYGNNSSLSGRTLDSHVRNIRAKAAALGYADIIETVRGVGLRLGPCTIGPNGQNT
ncbi:response regulator transcription factor [Rhizobium sp. BIGb0125]|uniref:response regulator transcription factor n=1 Tax=Rhizobium sp. BIGb0125 TaxID=2940618 RepID=UPI0021677645|nr:response regulator transcription factor [Rhizobium sp. BIGb0125]